MDPESGSRYQGSAQHFVGVSCLRCRLPAGYAFTVTSIRAAAQLILARLRRLPVHCDHLLPT